VAGWVGALGVLVAVNLLLNPMVPIIPDTIGAPNGPFDQNYYEPWLTVQPGFTSVERLIALIPSHEPVAASNNLFPLVANNLYAYDLSSIPINEVGFPFNYSAGPDWVLTSSASVRSGGHPLDTELPNASIFQLRGFVPVSTQGPILLYERGYVGAPELFGPELSAPSGTWTPGDGLALGSFGVWLPLGSPTGGPVIATNGTSGKVGLVAHADAGFLPPGHYTLGVELNRSAVALPPKNTTRVFDIRLLGFSGQVWETNVTVVDLPSAGWVTLSFPVALGGPAVDAEVEVNWEDVHAPCEIASLSLDAAD